MESSQVILAIRQGELDSDLDTIAHAIKTRQNWNASEQVYELKEGDRVKLHTNISPKYLANKVGTITDIDLNAKRGPTITIKSGSLRPNKVTGKVHRPVF